MDPTNHNSDFSKEATIVIGIPGTWEDIDAFRHALDQHSDGYSYSGMVLLEEVTQTSFGLEIVEHDPKLRAAYEATSFGQMSTAELALLDQHTLTIYLIGEGGSPEHAKALLPATLAILKAGGLAVKVETTGKAFGKAAWEALASSRDATHLYDAFVLKLHAEGDVYYTCGMHNLGLKDAIVGAVDEQVAAYTLDVFSMYQILEQPHIRPGESFAPKAGFPAFQLNEANDQRFAPDDTLYNRYGLWILQPIKQG